MKTSSLCHRKVVSVENYTENNNMVKVMCHENSISIIILDEYEVDQDCIFEDPRKGSKQDVRS